MTTSREPTDSELWHIIDSETARQSLTSQVDEKLAAALTAIDIPTIYHPDPSEQAARLTQAFEQAARSIPPDMPTADTTELVARLVDEQMKLSQKRWTHTKWMPNLLLSSRQSLTTSPRLYTPTRFSV